MAPAWLVSSAFCQLAQRALMIANQEMESGPADPSGGQKRKILAPTGNAATSGVRSLAGVEAAMRDAASLQSAVLGSTTGPIGVA